MKKQVKIAISIVAFAVVVAGAYLANYLNSVQTYKNAVDEISYVHKDVKNISDGSYIGECDVQFIYAKVKVTVKNHVITDIELLEHRHERGAAAESILKEIVARQEIDVDIVAGATNSSKVIKKAVDNALN
ncbi:MAG TPA: FMN-binding protein, partial [Clostridia bacterium]|nr:FMN-binding protein [Clostridia bacterium]